MATPHTFHRIALLHLPRFDASGSPSADIVPDVARRWAAPTIVSVSVLAGALSNVAAWRVNDPCVFYLGPGVFFGVMVLLPWCRYCGISWGQTLAAVVLAPIAHAAAVLLMLTYSAYSLAAPLVGCALMFAPIFVQCHARVRCALIAALSVGWVLGVALIAPCLALIGGVAGWQIAVAYCLSTALQVDDK
jgi:hypothetical protein